MERSFVKIFRQTATCLRTRGIFFPLLCIILSIVSCENKIETIKELANRDNLPGMEAETFELLFSDSAIVRFKLITPRIVQYDQNEKDPYYEFPDGVEIEKYNSDMEIESRITADYARNFEKEGKWIAKNNVVVVNQRGDTLKTEELIWEEKAQRFYTDKFVKIISPDRVINGIGMESDQNITNWKIKNISGDMDLKVNN